MWPAIHTMMPTGKEAEREDSDAKDKQSGLLQMCGTDAAKIAAVAVLSVLLVISLLGNLVQWRTAQTKPVML